MPSEWSRSSFAVDDYQGERLLAKHLEGVGRTVGSEELGVEAAFDQRLERTLVVAAIADGEDLFGHVFPFGWGKLNQ